MLWWICGKVLWERLNLHLRLASLFWQVEIKHLSLRHIYQELQLSSHSHTQLVAMPSQTIQQAPRLPEVCEKNVFRFIRASTTLLSSRLSSIHPFVDLAVYLFMDFPICFFFSSFVQIQRLLPCLAVYKDLAVV